jgi:hypothetical protein
MSHYRDNPFAIRKLVRDDAGRRDVWLDTEIFRLKLELL